MVEAKIDTDKKIFFIVVLALIVFGIGRAYAYFSAQANTSEQSVQTGTLKLEVETSEFITAENISPIDSSKIFEKATKLNFTVKNTGTIDIKANITLNILNITEKLKSNDFKWALYSGEIKITNGTFLNVTDKIVLATNLPITTQNSENYDLYIWIEETDVPQDELQKGILDAKITVDATQ